MTGKERILCAMEHKKGDRLPVFDVVNNPALYAEHLGVTVSEYKGGLAAKLAKKLGMDAVMVISRPYTCLIPPRAEFDGENTFTDRFGIKNVVTETSWPLGNAVGHQRLSRELLDTIRSAEITDEDVREVREAVKEAGDEIAVFGGVRSAFGFLFILLGMENMTEGLYEEPELLQEVIEAADGFWTRLGLKLLEAGCTGLYVANDMGMNGSTIISPAQLREFFFPSLRRQLEAWKAAGGRILFHSCGNVDAVLEDLADMGIDALNNIQVRSGMDLASAKARLGGRVCIVGNVDATEIMCCGDQNRITAAIRNVIELAGGDGGLIIATDHSFHQGIPTENVAHFLETARELGRF